MRLSLAALLVCLLSVPAAASTVPVCTGAVGADVPSVCRGRDVLYHNARVWTGEVDAPTFAQALLVRDGKVVATGSNADVWAQARPGYYAYNMQGGLVLPGFIDNHSHVAMLAKRRWRVGPHPSLWAPGPGPTLAELRTLVAAGAAAALPGEPVVVFYGAGLYAELNATGQTARAFFDSVTTTVPVYAAEWSGHAMAVNSLALEESGLRDYQPDSYGAWHGRDELGRHNGLLQEFALLPAVYSLSGRITDAEYIAQHNAYDSALLGKGGVVTADIRFAYDDTRAERVRLGMRRPAAMVGVCIITTAGKLCPPGQDGVVRRKVFADGTHVARSAHVSLPYLALETAPSGFRINTGTGIQNMSDAAFAWALQDTLERGGQLLVHAIGDAGIEQTLSLLEARPEVDWRGKVSIEHFDMGNPDQVARAAALGVYVGQNGTHLALIPPMMHAWNPPELYAEAEPLRSLIDAGVPLSFGTDAFGSDPAEDPTSGAAVAPNPWLDVMFAVAHPHYPHEAITVAEALGAYTRVAAESRLLPHLGTLTPGKDATFFLPNADPFSLSPGLLPTVTSCLTVVSGRTEHVDRTCF